MLNNLKIKTMYIELENLEEFTMILMPGGTGELGEEGQDDDDDTDQKIG